MRAALALALLGLIAGAHAAPRDTIEKGLGHIANMFETGMHDFINHERKFGQRLVDPLCERAAGGNHPIANELCDRASSRRRLSTIGDSMGSVQEFFSNMLGEGWSKFLPSSWNEGNFTWDALGEFDFKSNMENFMNDASVADLGTIDTMADVAALSDSIDNHFCLPDEYETGKKKPAGCKGPKVSIQLRPKVCELDPLAKQVLCEPAKLVLVKKPGSCNHKYVSSAIWTGKECKIAGQIGVEKEVQVGGNTHNIPLDEVDLPGLGDLIDLIRGDNEEQP